MNFPSGSHPCIIQGGMGVAVSGWGLANAVGSRGYLGVVSGTGIDVVFARRLQLGDIGGHLRAAIEAFPIPEIAERVLSRYFIPGGKDPKAPFKSKPVPALHPPKPLLELMVLANFVEVFLAKRGHSGPIGINLLEKIQLPTLPSLYGAMLAGVDYVLMGAGIPRQIPAILDSLSRFQDCALRVDVAGAGQDDVFETPFNPADFRPPGAESLIRPHFLAIVASNALATNLVKKCTPPVDGIVIEYPTAGGHNAPPRGTIVLDEENEPLYGPRDFPDLGAIQALGVPFWLAGSQGNPEGFKRAIEAGATGIQIGTAFAYCNESGLPSDLKLEVMKRAKAHQIKVRTDVRASPTGFPFKVLDLEGTLSEQDVYSARTRICDLGYLRQMYKKEDGGVGYRCASEPEEDFIAKGGTPEDLAGRKCVCNGLLATIKLGQTRKGVSEPIIVTSGNDVANIANFLQPGMESYSASDVLDIVLEAGREVEVEHRLVASGS